MYCNYFGFSEKPFNITADPDFLYLSLGHREMLATLIYGIRERKGLIGIIGEVGTGKTVLLKSLIALLENRTRCAYLCNSNLKFEDMLYEILRQLGIAIPDRGLTRAEAVERLHIFASQQLSKQCNVAIIVDEAQNLGRKALEQFRLLSDIETQKHKLIQIVLSGQPELDQKLKRYKLRQLSQRINLRRYVIPLSEEDILNYLQHRLAVSKYQGPPLFSEKALKLIREYSEGIPRKINVLCDNALLIAYALKKKQISVSIIQEAIQDLNWGKKLVEKMQFANLISVVYEQSKRRFNFRYPGRLLTAGCIFSALLIFITYLGPGGSAQTSSESRQVFRQVITTPPKILRQAIEPMAYSPDAIEVDKTLPPAPLAANASIAVKMPEMDTQKKPIEVSTEKSVSGIPSQTKADKQIIYVVVKKGESLSKILSRHFGRFQSKMLDQIIKTNPGIDVDQIEPGQVIKLPLLEDAKPVVYRGRFNGKDI